MRILNFYSSRVLMVLLVVGSLCSRGYTQPSIDSINYMRIPGIASYKKMLLSQYISEEKVIKGLNLFNNNFKGVAHHRIGTDEDFFHGHLLRASGNKPLYALFHTQEEIMDIPNNALSKYNRSYVLNFETMEINDAAMYVSNLDSLSSYKSFGTIHANELDRLVGYYQVHDQFEFYQVPCHFYENWEVINGHQTSLVKMDDGTCLNLIDFNAYCENCDHIQKAIKGKRTFLIQSFIVR